MILRFTISDVQTGQQYDGQVEVPETCPAPGCETWPCEVDKFDLDPDKKKAKIRCKCCGHKLATVDVREIVQIEKPRLKVKAEKIKWPG